MCCQKTQDALCTTHSVTGLFFTVLFGVHLASGVVTRYPSVAVGPGVLVLWLVVVGCGPFFRFTRWCVHDSQSSSYSSSGLIESQLHALRRTGHGTQARTQTSGARRAPGHTGKGREAGRASKLRSKLNMN